jgi:hypothetical protein
MRILRPRRRKPDEAQSCGTQVRGNAFLHSNKARHSSGH